jgi:hypothetical protein
MYKVYNSRMSAQKLHTICVTIAINCEILISFMNVSCILGYEKITVFSVTIEYVYLKCN